MAVITYSYKRDKEKYCSAHTQVREMRSKDGADTILVDTSLMAMIEKLFTKMQCSKYIISSGYRTPAYDKAVGGNGKGQHTLGKAVDACFYWKDGSIIPAQVVCCAAQDLGFKGIANISKKYQYVHLDMRTTGRRYLGDEIKGTNTVTSNFYEYFKLSAADVAKYTGAIQYFARYTGSSHSISAALKSLGESYSYKYRVTVAKANSISGYTGTAAQNIQMLNLLKQGKLIKP